MTKKQLQNQNRRLLRLLDSIDAIARRNGPRSIMNLPVDDWTAVRIYAGAARLPTPPRIKALVNAYLKRRCGPVQPRPLLTMLKN